MARSGLRTEDYDEFGFLDVYASHAGLPFPGRPAVRRETVDIGDDRAISVVAWGEEPPELVFMHGGGQNAHTWDTVALALGRPLLAVDLPGHGQSYRRDDRDYWPVANAEAVATVLDKLGVHPLAVVGMSLGGLTNIRLAATRPDLVPRAVIVDVTPAVRGQELTPEQRGASALTGGPRLFESFDAMLEAAVSAARGRSAESLEIGVRHNAMALPDGQWTWRYDVLRKEGEQPLDFTPLWEDLASLRCPTMLVRGGSSFHVPDEHAAEFAERLPGARLEVVEGAGHSVQSDRPRELAALLEDFIATTTTTTG